MRGLGRNIWFQVRTIHKSLLEMVFMVLLYALFMWICVGTEELVVTLLPPGTIILGLSIILAPTQAGTGLVSIAIPLGSARKQGGMAVIITQHIFLIEVGILIFLGAVLLKEQQLMQNIKACPWGIVGVALLLMALAFCMNIASLYMETKVGSILFVILILLEGAVAFGAMICAFAFDIEQIRRVNYPIAAVIALVADVVATYCYYKVIQKVDLKVA